jgi:hypothetical protein
VISKQFAWLVAALAFTTSFAANAADRSAPIAQTEQAISTDAPLVHNADAIELDSDPAVISDPRFFPAVFSKRRFGPIEEPEEEFYTLRNEDVPGFEWNPPSFGWGLGWGSGWGLGWNRFNWVGASWGFPRFGFSFVGYNRYASRPWYSSPSRPVWSNRYPWYTPGGSGPNIYTPWYTTRANLPWYSPLSDGPNIYTPTSQWRAFYPWYSPIGPGPNIYTPDGEQGGCLYW